MDPDSSQRNGDETVPDLTGRYRVEAKLGEGGMGVVYRAYDLRLQRRVAIKMLNSVSDAVARTQLLQEARAASALNHPNICTVHEVDEAGQLPFIVMEFVDGTPLSEMIPHRGLAPGTVVRYGLQIAEALAHAHERGIVHGDVKASNVLMTPEGRPKVVDFGLAKRVGVLRNQEATTRSLELVTEPGVLRGTLSYMAPEQLRGASTDARSDVWSLGVLLFEMTAGVPPFRGQTGFELSSDILSQSPSALPEHAPEALKAVIGRCLEKDPQRRYQRAGEVRAALETMPPDSAVHSLTRPLAGQRSSRTVVIASAILVLAGLATWWGGLERWRSRGSAQQIRSIAVLP